MSITTEKVGNALGLMGIIVMPMLMIFALIEGHRQENEEDMVQEE